MMTFVLKYRIPLLVVMLVLTGLLGAQIPNMTSNAGVDALLPHDDPDYRYWQETEKIFGAAEQIVIGITAGDSIYTPEHLQLVHDMSAFFENLDDIDPDDVLSLTTVDDMQGLDDELVIDPLVDADALVMLDVSALEALRERVRSNPLFHGKLVSLDDRSTVVLAGVLSDVTDDEHRSAALKAAVDAKVAELRAQYPDTEILLSGMPIMNALITEYMQRDISRLFPLAMLVVVALLFILLRSVMGMVAPILVTLFAIVWTFGLKGAVGSPMTIAETIIPVMLIAIGCADGVHILSEFREFSKKGYAVKDAILATMHLLAIPVIMTSVTTAIGFGSLITSPGMSIRNMGLYLGFGVLVAMVFSLFFIPIALSFTRLKVRVAPAQSHAARSDRYQRIMARVGTGILQYRVPCVIVTMAVLGFSLYGALNVQVESSEFKYLKVDNALRVATEKIGDRLGGIVSLDIVFEGRAVDAMKAPAMLKAMRQLQVFAEQQELVSYSLSLADYIERLNYVLHANDPAFQRIPDETEIVAFQEFEMVDNTEVLVDKTEAVSGFEQVAQFLLLYDMGGGAALDDVVDSDYMTARVILRLNDTSSQELAKLMAILRPYAEENFGDLNAGIRFSNYYAYLPVSQLIITSQIYSLISVCAAIVILLSIIFRSFVAGALTSVPVFVAVLFDFAVMWLGDITLNIGTSIVAAIGMGIGIDYAIHYYVRFRAFYQQSGDYTQALIQAITDTSRAILTNAAAVGAGFLVLIFSEYYAIASVGWVTALSMLTTAVSSLVVLPALLSIFKPKVAAVRRRAAELPSNIVTQS